mmetsp:Transcript_4514/g.7543  ORF Transcript_4514/g.7543 Transcript_4514/m.7543 type:complete len:236 (-) Transcript_4514:219-926(-)
MAEIAVAYKGEEQKMANIEDVNPAMAKEDVHVFADSTHCFIFEDVVEVNGEQHKVGFVDRLYAYLVITFQYGVYLYLATLAASDIKGDTVPVEIGHANCGDDNSQPSLANLECSANDESPVPIFLALITLAFFIMPDVAGCLQLFKRSGVRSKIAALFILGETMLALAAGAIFARLGNVSSSGDAFLGCVGVVFVHDIDEKIKASMDNMKSPLLIIPFVLMAVVFGVIVMFSISA